MTSRAGNIKIHKSPQDPNSYRYIRLKNYLNAVLVSVPRKLASSHVLPSLDPWDQLNVPPQYELTDDMGVVAVCVKAGESHVPYNMSGLASLTARSLLGGSEKYHEYAYASKLFATSMDGRCNVRTSAQHTMFHMIVAKEHIEECVDRMADLLSKPTFDTPVVQYEAEAIDVEYRVKQCQDTWRWTDMLNRLVKPGHPLSMSAYGNMHSLRMYRADLIIFVHAEMEKFFHRHYYGKNMTVCVLSPQPLDDLERFVRNSFDRIPKNPIQTMLPVEVRGYDMPYSHSRKFRKLHEIVPIDLVHKIVFRWELPPQLRYYRRKSVEYIQHVIKDPSRNGLPYWLFQKGWLTDLATHTTSLADGAELTTLFSIDLTLTHSGMRKVVQVSRYVHQFLHAMRARPPCQHVWLGLKKAAATEPWIKPTLDRLELAEHIAESLHFFPKEDVLVHEYKYEAFNKDHIMRLLGLMTPQLCSTLVVSARFRRNLEEFPLRDPWSGMRWRCSSYPDSWKCFWKSDRTFQERFAFPRRNPYLVSDLSLGKNEGSKKELEFLGTLGLWHLYSARGDYPDDPKCSIYLKQAGVSLKKANFNDLKSRLLITAIKLRLLPHSTRLAETGHTMMLGSRFDFTGFSPMIAKFLKKFFLSLSNLHLSETQMEVVREMFLHRLASQYRDNSAYADYILKHYFRHTGLERGYREIMAISAHDLARRANTWLHTQFDILFTGNISTTTITTVLDDVKDALFPGTLATTLELDSDSEIDDYKAELYTQFHSYPGAIFLPGSTNVIQADYSGISEPPHRHHIRVLTQRQDEKCSYIFNYYYVLPESQFEEIYLILFSLIIAPIFEDFIRRRGLRSYDLTCFYHHVPIKVPHCKCVTQGIAFSLSTPANHAELSRIDVAIDYFMRQMSAVVSEMETPFEEMKERLKKIYTREGEKQWAARYLIYWEFCRRGRSLARNLEHREHPFNVVLSQLDFKSFANYIHKRFDHGFEGYSKVSVQIVGWGSTSMNDCIGGCAIGSAYKTSSVPKDTRPYLKDVWVLLPRNRDAKTFAKNISEFKIPIRRNVRRRRAKRKT